jgi:CelD/BcsL family acetyltransferase involved in cellulose biosynthesis
MLEQLDIDATEADWRRLADRSRSIFASWEWARTWLRHFGGEELVLLGRRDPGGDLRVLVPFVRSGRFPLRMLRLVGHGPGDELGPVCAEEDRQLGLETLVRALVEQRGWDVFLGERLRGDWDLNGLGARRLGFESSPALVVEGRSWDEILAARSSNFRQQVRRRERKLAREHELRFRLTTSPDELEADLDLLFGLHAARWEGERTRFLQAEPFHRDFAAQALERGWLRLWIAEIDGRPAAAWYGFRYAGIEGFYQTGREPAFDHTSIGFVLINHTVRAAVEDGVREYSFLRGGEGYKDRFADRDLGVQTVVVPGSPVGRLAADTSTTLARRPRARQLLRQLPV